MLVLLIIVDAMESEFMPIPTMKAIVISNAKGAAPIEWNPAPTSAFTQTKAVPKITVPTTTVSSPVCIPTSNISPRALPTLPTINPEIYKALPKTVKSKSVNERVVEAFSMQTGQVLRSFRSIKEAAVALSLSQYSIIENCKGKKENAGNVGWRFHTGADIDCKFLCMYVCL